MKVTIGWLTIVSFLLNIALSGLSLYQFLDSKKQEDNLKMVVRSWQNQAEGLSTSLTTIAFSPNNFSTKYDMAQAVSVASSYAYSLNQALAQQRFYTDTEVRTQKEESSKNMQQILNQYKSISPLPNMSITPTSKASINP